MLHRRTPIPRTTARAIDFAGNSSADAIRISWANQLKRTRSLLTSSHYEQANGTGDRRSYSGKPAAAPTHATKYLTGRGGINQFICGFPTAWDIGQRFTYPAGNEIDRLISTSDIYKKNQRRPKGRDSELFNKNSSLRWGEALDQVNQGWGRPLLPQTPSKSRELAHPRWNIASRPGGYLGDKIRAFGDMRIRETNQSRAALASIEIESRGQIAETCRDIENKSRDLGFLKVDHASAYKQFPDKPGHAKYSAAAPKSPKMVWPPPDKLHDVWISCVSDPLRLDQSYFRRGRKSIRRHSYDFLLRGFRPPGSCGPLMSAFEFLRDFSRSCVSNSRRRYPIGGPRSILGPGGAPRRPSTVGIYIPGSHRRKLRRGATKSRLA